MSIGSPYIKRYKRKQFSKRHGYTLVYTAHETVLFSKRSFFDSVFERRGFIYFPASPCKRKHNRIVKRCDYKRYRIGRGLTSTFGVFRLSIRQCLTGNDAGQGRSQGGGGPGVPVTPPFVSLFVSKQPTIFS